ncbi:MAG TPA: MotA/TolQ/ExbB proton channel family protein [Bacteroidales bacterium]|jgi:biopolymer transport protein ExbB|nr:MotA/TolQ/ExbB proton channel family protein [Bacteroidales bacterium]HRW20920.1 MotA/TolQ/ExbB proton channel family protein [Bacteroidales bacterium]HXK82017.1 MotA/TolQ/ExbB proton channel family protein [Bacteroidales bacterium]
MKKLIALLTVAGILMFFVTSSIMAQDETEQIADEQTEQVSDEAVEANDTAEPAVDEAVETDEEEGATQEKTPMHQQLKIKFIEGGPTFMGFVLVALILGLALAFERIIYLNLASANTKKLLEKVESAINEGGVEAAKEVCRNTRGPVASIFYQGLSRYNSGIDVVEKSVVSYGSVQMGLLEKGLTWIALFIAIAPMLGFMGTVIGMIAAFDAIEAAGDINPSLVAGGIKVALITTVSGLIVAMILQVFYNYIVSKIDAIVNDMEDASISLIDILVEYQHKNA